MPHAFGYRARTRTLFARKFREHGVTHLSAYLRKYKVGDLVDIKVNSSIHKGLPNKFYHGKTGRVFNVSKRALGVKVSKPVNGRIVHKFVNIRVEHLEPSTSQLAHIARVQFNEKAKAENKNNPNKPSLKRSPALPRGGLLVKGSAITTIQPKGYVDLV